MALKDWKKQKGLLWQQSISGHIKNGKGRDKVV